MLYCETLVDDIGQRGVLVMKVKSIIPALLALLLTVAVAALANSEWVNLAEDQRVYAEFGYWQLNSLRPLGAAIWS